MITAQRGVNDEHARSCEGFALSQRRRLRNRLACGDGKAGLTGEHRTVENLGVALETEIDCLSPLVRRRRRLDPHLERVCPPTRALSRRRPPFKL